jgi:hypothetical protein
MINRFADDHLPLIPSVSGSPPPHITTSRQWSGTTRQVLQPGPNPQSHHPSASALLVDMRTPSHDILLSIMKALMQPRNLFEEAWALNVQCVREELTWLMQSFTGQINTHRAADRHSQVDRLHSDLERVAAELMKVTQSRTRTAS